jgi:hypothetical protein
MKLWYMAKSAERVGDRTGLMQAISLLWICLFWPEATPSRPLAHFASSVFRLAEGRALSLLVREGMTFDEVMRILGPASPIASGDSYSLQTRWPHYGIDIGFSHDWLSSQTKGWVVTELRFVWDFTQPYLPAPVTETRPRPAFVEEQVIPSWLLRTDETKTSNEVVTSWLFGKS